MDDARFCPRCAAPLVPGEEGRPRCSQCDFILYRDPKVAVAAVLETGGRLLLVRRAIDPGLGLWSFPAGYVDRGEQLEEALKREVREELALDIYIEGLVGVYSEPGVHVVLIVYAATIRPDSASPKIGPENSDVGTFAPDAFPPMAFAHDRRIVKDWMRVRMSQAWVS